MWSAIRRRWRALSSPASSPPPPPSGLPPFRSELARLAAEAAAAEPGGELLAWGRRALALSPAAERDWHTRALWGQRACPLVRTYLREGRADEVLDLVLPFDLAPLEAALAAGRGAVLSIAHVGPAGLDRELMIRTPHDVLLIAARSWSVREGFRIFQVTSDSERKQALALSLLHLRRNGVVMIAADGPFGARGRPYPFLRHSARLRRGTGELARLSRAPLLWLHTVWEPASAIRIVLEPSGLVPGGDAEAWEHEWMSAYLARLEGIARRHPESLRLEAWAHMWTSTGGERESDHG